MRTLGRADVLDALLPEMRAAAESGAKDGGPRVLAGLHAYLKSSPLRGKASVRHGLRRLLGIAPPRLNEFRNLEWLRAHGFLAPRPLAAGVFFQRWRPTFQFLATEAVPRAVTLRELVDERPRDARPELIGVLDTLGGEVRRLHAAGFVHRDLYPRNLLVTDADSTPRIHFLDAWRGGPGFAPPLRGRGYDVACLLGALSGRLTPEEAARLRAALSR